MFTSLGTLVCCALPALMVSVGMGAALAGLIGTFPSITLISNHKVYVFIISGFLIFLGFFTHWSSKNVSCPTDLTKAKLCKKLRSISSIMLHFSLTLYLIGFFFAFIATHVFF